MSSSEDDDPAVLTEQLAAAPRPREAEASDDSDDEPLGVPKKKRPRVEEDAVEGAAAEEDEDFAADDDDEEDAADDDDGAERPKKRSGTAASRARHSEWEERLRTEVGWTTRADEELNSIGKRVRDDYGRYTTTAPGETPRKIAAAEGIDLAEFLRVNVKRWYATLVGSSWVEAGTRFFLPQPKGAAEELFTDGKIVAVNEMSQVWHVVFDDGDECDMAYEEVTLAIWNARKIDEEWQAKPGDHPLLGKRVRRPFGYGFAKAKIVAYLPEGAPAEQEPEMWHIIHDFDGDHEDLEKDEIEAAVKAWDDYTVAELARKSSSVSEGGSGAVEGAEKQATADGEGGSGDAAAAAAAVFEVGKNVLADNLGTIYPAKVVQVEAGRYFVHYHGWKKRFDEWLLPANVFKPEDPVATERLEQQKAAKAAAKAGLGQNLLSLPIPLNLYTRLKMELTSVGEEARVLVLPRVPTVVQILQQWLEVSGNPGEVNPVAVVTWLRAYFEVALPSVLLYEQERWQLEDIYAAQAHAPDSKMQLGEIYGAEHLLRLLAKLPALVAAEEASSGVISVADTADRKQLEQLLASLMNFLRENDRLFGTGSYQSQRQRLA